MLNEFASAFGIPQGQDSMDLTQRLVRRLSEAKTNEQQLAERVQGNYNNNNRITW